MSDEAKNGIKWLVEERERLQARVAVLESELVRRDEAAPVWGRFSVQIDELEAQRIMLTGETTVPFVFAERLAREIVVRSLHRIAKGPNGDLRLFFEARPA